MGAPDPLNKGKDLRRKVADLEDTSKIETSHSTWVMGL